MIFQFHYTITDDDYIKFNLNHALNTKIGKKASLISKLAVPVLSALILLMLSLFSGDFGLLLTGAILCIFWIVFFKKITLRNIKKNVRMMKKSGRLPYNEYGTLTFEENFICDAAPTQETKTSYNLIEAIYTTDEAIYIYISAASAIILPYRFIENQTVFNKLVDFLQKKTGKSIINITK